MTIQTLLDRAPDFSESMPHNFTDNADEEGVSRATLQMLRSHLESTNAVIRQFEAHHLPKRLQPSPQPSLPDSVVILELTGTAHPDKYPRWWVTAKIDLVRVGKPEDLVPISAYPRRWCETSSRGGNTKKGDPEGSAPDLDSGGSSSGASGVAGAFKDGLWPKRATLIVDAGAGPNSNNNSVQNTCILESIVPYCD
jgi:hypothetical protein